MRCYLSGWQATNYKHESALIKAGVVKHRCVSFAYVHKMEGVPYYCKGTESSYEACLENKVGIMMDSGVFSFRILKQKLERLNSPKLKQLPTEEQFIEKYVAYAKKNEHLWDFCVTTDLDWNSKNNFKRHQKLESLGLRTVPVYHGDSHVDWLRRYHDRGYDLISIASPVWFRSTVSQKRRFFDSIFNLAAQLNLRLHGLALTSPWIMLDFPWWSVDSSSWSRSASTGSIIRFDAGTERLSTVHVSDRACAVQVGNTDTLNRIKKYVEAEGFDWHKLQTDYVARHLYNAGSMLKLAAYAEGRNASGGWKLLF